METVFRATTKDEFAHAVRSIQNGDKGTIYVEGELGLPVTQIFLILDLLRPASKSMLKKTGAAGAAAAPFLFKNRSHILALFKDARSYSEFLKILKTFEVSISSLGLSVIGSAASFLWTKFERKKLLAQTREQGPLGSLCVDLALMKFRAYLREDSLFLSRQSPRA